MRFTKQKFLHLGVALGMALVAGTAAGLSYVYRDSLFEWGWVRPTGVFRDAEDPSLRRAALQYLQDKLARPGEVCVDQWVGRDDRYLYMAVGCARFEEKFGLVEPEGDRNFYPTRFRYSGGAIEHFEQPDGAQFKNALRRLFPREAVALLMVRMSEEQFKKLGREKYLANLSASP